MKWLTHLWKIGCLSVMINHHTRIANYLSLHPVENRHWMVAPGPPGEAEQGGEDEGGEEEEGNEDAEMRKVVRSKVARR